LKFLLADTAPLVDLDGGVSQITGHRHVASKLKHSLMSIIALPVENGGITRFRKIDGHDGGRLVGGALTVAGCC